MATGCWPASPACRQLVVNDIVARYGSLQKMMRATTEDLEDVDRGGSDHGPGGQGRLARLAESSILDRYS